MVNGLATVRKLICITRIYIYRYINILKFISNKVNNLSSEIVFNNTCNNAINITYLMLYVVASLFTNLL